MSWDQRHTFNLSLGYNTEKFGVTATGYYNSGTPYTFSPQGESSLALLNLYPNNDYKPSNYHADLSGYINLPKIFGLSPKIDFIIYNLLDRYNEYGVSSETGRAYTSVVNETELLSHRSNFNTYDDRYKDPSMFQAPRQIKSRPDDTIFNMKSYSIIAFLFFSFIFSQGADYAGPEILLVILKQSVKDT